MSSLLLRRSLPLLCKGLPVSQKVPVQVAYFSRAARGRKTIKSKRDDDNDDEGYKAPPPASVPVDPSEAWIPVQDKASGLTYYWNTVTNETTQLGAPRPTGPTSLAPQQTGLAPQGGGGGGMLSGLGGVMAQGMAFGAGSAVAHNVIGSMFGGGGHHHSDSGGASNDVGGGDDTDSWDV